MAPTNPYLVTATGHQFPLLNPQPSDVRLADIAQALGRIQRFNGHTRLPYTVAEHSVLVALILREAGHGASLQLAGLFHDAAEAYIGDMPTPIKWALDAIQPYSGVVPIGTKAWDELEERIEDVIRTAYGLPVLTLPDQYTIKLADAIALSTEGRDLLSPAIQWFNKKPAPHELSLQACLLKAQFLYSSDGQEVTPMELFLDVYTALVKEVETERLIQEYGQ